MPPRWSVLPPRTRRIAIAAAAALLALVVLPILRSGVATAPAPPAPTVALSTVTLPIPPTVAPLPQVASLAPDAVCAVRNDGRTALAVSFTLVNASAGVVTLESARPYLPLPGMLRAVGVEVRPGGCGSAGAITDHRTLVPGERLLVTFRFALTATCPQPAPVGASIRERTLDDRELTSRHVLFNDLGGYAFDTCPTG
jgi:hypothetical protein